MSGTRKIRIAFCILLLLLLMLHKSATSPARRQLKMPKLYPATSNFVEPKLRVIPHPSTYFSPGKNLVTQIRFIGVQLTLPISNVTKHATKALDQVTKILSSNILHSPAKAGNSSLETVTAHMLMYKKNTLERKIRNLNSNVEKHNSAPTDIHQDLHLRDKRDISVSFNPTEMLNAFFSGINSIFHWKGLAAVEGAVKNLAFKQSHMESFIETFSLEVTKQLRDLNSSIKKKFSNLSITLSCFILMDEAESALDILIAALAPMLQGLIPSVLLDHSSMSRIYENLLKQVQSKGRALAVDSPNELWSMKHTTYQTDGSWGVLMSIPTFDPKDTMKSFEFINFPTIHSSSVKPLRWNINPAIYAEIVTLYPNVISHLSIELHQVNQICQEYNSLLICEKQLIHEPSCLSDLFHNISTRCELVESVNQKSIQLTRSHKLLIFFLEETEILIYCGDAVEKMNLQGLYEIINVNDCKISSATFSYHVNGREPHMYIEEPPSIIVSDNVTLEHLDKYLQRNESAAQEPQVLSHLLKAWQQQKNDTNIENNPFVLPELALPSLIISGLVFLMFLATGMWFCIKAYKIMQ